MARSRKTCTLCGRRFLVYRKGIHDVQYYICPDCKGGLEELTHHKPYVQDVQPKEGLL